MQTSLFQKVKIMLKISKKAALTIAATTSRRFVSKKHSLQTVFDSNRGLNNSIFSMRADVVRSLTVAVLFDGRVAGHLGAAVGLKTLTRWFSHLERAACWYIMTSRPRPK